MQGKRILVLCKLGPYRAKPGFLFSLFGNNRQEEDRGAVSKRFAVVGFTAGNLS
jgi:hypothetical protein